ncbi:N-acetylglucosamine-6-phosphate deacetylase [Sporanaerobium hydrogeniformans]|uniref:N-acetylglucosamine-6-phosphate deacetylase n=1 Tax=Sporanaerobium hydrogeniformans TaxID=3072179 RepID=A0AC61D9K6_9FIRM|nr:N-acetylglucosamine-6-phosphate deacetylase [Sporanaerobium hydrogeniformans]PHV69428.1 N-acetylglucosamine-6-phosphate deacetylase [Sporanaerobium hydrogeniformans]
MLIKNGLVFTDSYVFLPKDILTTNHQVTDILPPFTDSFKTALDVYDATNCYVIPGLTDIHFHGCMNHDFCEGTPEAIEAIATYQLSQGITTICPATMTLPKETLIQICQVAGNYKPLKPQATLCGINLEGPFLSLEKKGAQNATYLHKPDNTMLRHLLDASHQLIKLVAIAPEEEGALECIKQFKKEVVFSLAHTTADYDKATQAFKAGASHVTHLYNAMPSFTHRAPGVIGAAFDAPHCQVELICDGIHIHPSVVRATFKLFGDERVILVSDSMMACGMPNGKYKLGDQTVHVNQNRATLEDGTIAGSVTHLMDCMRIAVSMGIPLESAIKATTINPAKSIGIDNDYGSITPGKIANLAILRKDLSLQAVIFEGKLIDF